MKEKSVATNEALPLPVKERKRWLFFGLPFTFTTYTLAEKKLILRQGFFNINENETLLYRVVDMTLRRSLIQRIFGLGTLMVEAQDKTHPTLVIKNIRHSKQFRDLFSQAVENDKIRLRMRQGELIDPDMEADDLPQPEPLE